VHIGTIDDINKIGNPRVQAIVDAGRRKSVARNHTATHLLHKALRETLGTHVTQAGSLVAPDHLRFDVTHFQKISAPEVETIETLVNRKVREDLAVATQQMSYFEAREQGAMAIFEEKYGDQVRVVRIDDFSMELCGGTHLNHTGEIGYFRIISESSAAAGIRRLEAVTGEKSDDLLRNEKKVAREIQDILNCQTAEVIGKIRSILAERNMLEKELHQLRLLHAGDEVGSMIEGSKKVSDFNVVTSEIQSENVEELKQIGDKLRSKLGSGVGVLSTVINGKASFICVVTDDLIKKRHLNAGDIVKKVAAIASGGGGGRPHMALAGAKDVGKITEALEKVPEIVDGFLGQEGKES
jgi:alanyl-tRNA synthetase